MANYLYKFLYNLKTENVDLNWGREIIKKWTLEEIEKKDTVVKILDIGIGPGTDLNNIVNSTSKELELFGIENNKDFIQICEQHKIKIVDINLEKDHWPLSDETFDIIIINQVIEHVKELFWLFSEVSRVAKKNSLIIVGTPNLASLHNRLALLFGQQPTSINPISAHIRGFTAQAFIDFITYNNFFTVKKIVGSNFYPFPRRLSNFLSYLFPKLSVALFFLIKRTDKSGNFIEILNNKDFETPFYRG